MARWKPLMQAKTTQEQHKRAVILTEQAREVRAKQKEHTDKSQPWYSVSSYEREIIYNE